MKSKSKQSGVTLTEMTVVVGAIALLAAFGLPAARTFFNTFESGGSAKGLISAGLASARAIAASRQHYAGIRFQQDLQGNQYMVFVIQDSQLGAYFFRAVEGIKPIKLPESLGVMDFAIVTDRNTINPANPTEEFRLDDPSLSDTEKNDLVDEDRELTDMTAFSIIFSPSGKLVIHGIRVRSRFGTDDIFNTKPNVDAGTGMFYQDDYYEESATDLGLGPEPSRRAFVIYNKKRLDSTDILRRWSDYLVELRLIYISPYTGTIISVD
jgi:Tfp pilus assembly protein FimT